MPQGKSSRGCQGNEVDLPEGHHAYHLELPPMIGRRSRHHRDGITGGKVSVPHSRPYMVYIRDNKTKATCGGFLVRQDFVMTAAHCKQSHLMVYLGVDDTNHLPYGVEVDPIPHPEFTMKRPGHDIMLLKLKTPATLNKIVGTINLPKTVNEKISKNCMVMGWGWKKNYHESPSNVLKEANVNLIDSENCGMADTLCTEGSSGPAQLKTPATLNKTVSIITFPKTENEEISKDCTVMGWGWQDYHHESPSSVLKEESVTLIDSANCGTADALCTEGSTGPARDGIVGGKVSVPHSRPYMVYIRDNKTKRTCSGFLVREDFVMTAAHCKQSHLMVYLGVSDTSLLPDGVEVDPIPHPEFTMKRPGHDIMLLKLKTPATLNKTVSTITFPKKENEKISENCMVMGWGWQDYHHMSPSNVLKEATVTLIDSENCGTPDTLCTEGSTGPARGDSGGPLVCGGVAQGIVSFYKSKDNGDHLSVYTYISHYIPWIQRIMNSSTQQQYETWKDKLDNLM
ncbi:hypothetical protein Q8A67_005941 [Cirrhinus molitorella]|uniref:trypsin n=1 Tax=Cirrhinus molitorella TaxID=172907 RepID=A0AA88U2M5_9TELE|nr:hypothetical protein Q8A67_005941 [Cirrhinus molitorella]